MAVTNPEYDIDMSGLDNLFNSVVAFVEVRSDFEDISYEIAREMRQMGATISDKRVQKVTHVIFRDGTFRTSNWAKKHNVPLVSVGWLAACARSKMKLLCAPWRVPYMEEIVDECGLKKKVRYKKYCKWMNAEEFEADMNRSAERSRKRLDKSLNKSQINNSFGSDNNAEYERVMKLSDPCLRPRPPTPEFVKKHRRRHERLRLGGRYSWESSDEENGSTSNEDSQKSPSDSLIVSENVKPASLSNSDNDKITGIVKEDVYLKGARRLFKDDNDAIETLIEPIRKVNKRKVINLAIPRAVLKKVEKPNPSDNKRRRQPSQEDCSSPKRMKLGDSSNILKSTKLELDTSVLFKTPPQTKTIPTSNTALSPLVTNKATAISTKQVNFVTPTNKRKSLRTRLLKRSARKRIRDSESDTPSPVVLVPETNIAERKRPSFTKQMLSSPTDLFVIPETPPSSSDNRNSISMSSSLIGNMFDTPNTSRVLNEIIPNRVKSQNNDHILFVPKDSYNHYSRALTPLFKEQIKFITDNFPRKSVNKIGEILNSKKTQLTVKEPIKTRTNVRRSARLSNCFEISSIDDTNVFKPEEEKETETETKNAVIIFKKDNLDIESADTKKRYNTRRSITINVAPVIENKTSLKRLWSEANPEIVKKSTIKPTKDPLKGKKFRDSTDDFIFNILQNKKPVSKVSVSSPKTIEIVIVGLEQEELAGIRGSCARLPHKYTCADLIRTKEQLIIVPDKPKKNIDILKGLIFGNTFVSLSWVLESIVQKKWLDSSRYIMAYTDIAQCPTVTTTQLFKEHTAMYISTSANTLPKYKLRLIIEQSGGIVTDSFRQAGIVIDTRKVNGLSVKSSWILDCVKEGRILDESNYLIT